MPCLPVDFRWHGMVTIRFGNDRTFSSTPTKCLTQPLLALSVDDNLTRVLFSQLPPEGSKPGGLNLAPWVVCSIMQFCWSLFDRFNQSREGLVAEKTNPVPLVQKDSVRSLHRLHILTNGSTFLSVIRVPICYLVGPLCSQRQLARPRMKLHPPQLACPRIF